MSAPLLDVPESGAQGVTATIAGDDTTRYAGAAVLRRRPHPLTHAPSLQLGVPDDALGFRPHPGVSYDIHAEDPDGAALHATSTAVWLERVQTSWWFVLTPHS